MLTIIASLLTNNKYHVWLNPITMGQPLNHVPSLDYTT